MMAVATDEGVCLLEFLERKELEQELKVLKKTFKMQTSTESNKHLQKLEIEVNEYFEGKRKEFEVPLVISGTPFQKQTWQALQAINYGETRSYKQQADALKNPKAIRAVARANGSNKIAIVIPCHRVIGSSGQLTGYAAGLERKKYLLDLEKQNQ
jgi:AraC family transcriptional regulator of adaptative response/methylated-DNA-[protein]-cysteine methyltransferase